MVKSGLAPVEGNLDRDALDNSGEVARRIVRRQQRELRAAGRRQAVDPSGECAILHTVHGNGDGIARPYLRKLCFLEVGDDPEIVWHYRDQQRTGPYILAQLRLALSDPAGRGCTHHGIVEFDLGKLEDSDGGIDIGLELRPL